MANNIKELELSKGCKLTHFVFGDKSTCTSIEYTEHTPDSWYGDQETEVELTVEQAVAIIAFLKESFSL